MRYETLLFTRNQRQDFTAFIRPALLSNKDVSAIGGIFNYVSDISRLTPDFPSLYCFPLGEYVLVLRHYNSGRTHAGRAIGVIEGTAVRQDNAGELPSALARFVDQQAELLNVMATVSDIETQATEASPVRDWDGRPLRAPAEPFVGEFLERRSEDRLFLPFSERGRAMLIAALADRRFGAPPYFAFGTNADTLEQLERCGTIEVASYFNTERACFRSRTNSRVTGIIDPEPEEAAPEPSMALRPVSRDEMRVRPEPALAEPDDETLVEGMSIRSTRRSEPLSEPVVDDDDTEPTVLTMRQMRDRMLAEEASEETPRDVEHLDPIHWLLRLVSSLISPNKPR